MRFLEVYLKENHIKVPTQILELYNYLKSGKSEMVDPRTVDIVTGTFFHFTKSHKENFNDLKFNKKSFYQDFGLPENYIFDDGVLYAYSLHDLTEKRKTITSIYGNDCFVFDGVAINCLVEMDQEYQNVVAFSTIKNKSFVEDFFFSNEYKNRNSIYKELESLL